jgi:hypothetical protein
VSVSLETTRTIRFFILKCKRLWTRMSVLEA